MQVSIILKKYWTNEIRKLQKKKKFYLIQTLFNYFKIKRLSLNQYQLPTLYSF